MLEQALTHRSKSSVNNERLEFLGDSILSYIISERLYAAYPDEPEGNLTRMRAALVKGETLTAISQSLGLGEYLRLGQGEQKSGGYRRESTLADAFEALLGAIYLDGGIEPVRTLCDSVFEPRIAKLPPVAQLKDPKTRLQEELQSRGLPLPDYQIRNTSGKAHAQVFHVECLVADLDIIGVGKGSSRKKAQQAAAEDCLSKINAAANHTSGKGH